MQEAIKYKMVLNLKNNKSKLLILVPMDFTNRLSILVACYNEERSITTMLENVIVVQLTGWAEKEIIVIDDAYSDKTYSLVEAFIKKNARTAIQLYRHEKNAGK